MKHVRIHFALLLVVVAVAACRKETKPTLSPHKATTSANARVTNNPEEYIGIAHNNILGGISGLVAFPNTSTLQDLSIAEEVVSGIFSNYTSPTNGDIETAMAETMTLEQLVDFYYQENEMNIYQYSAFQELIEIMDLSQSADDVLEMVAGFEDDLALNTDLTNTEKIPLYATASVLANSSEYWDAAETTLSHPWYNVGDPDPKPKWWADTKGFVYGFFVCKNCTLDDRLTTGVIVSGLYSAAAAK